MTILRKELIALLSIILIVGIFIPAKLKAYANDDDTDSSIINHLELFEQGTGKEVGKVAFQGQTFDTRLKEYISNINQENQVEFQIVEKELQKSSRYSSSINDQTMYFTVNYYKVLLENNSGNPFKGIRPKFIPDGVLYDNSDYSRRMNDVYVFYEGKELGHVNNIKYTTTDQSIREMMSTIDSSKYYYSDVSVSRGYTSVYNAIYNYSGQLNTIKINVKAYEDLEAPTTEAPTTEVPTTEVPTTEAPTEEPTIEESTTEDPFVYREEVDLNGLVLLKSVNVENQELKTGQTLKISGKVLNSSEYQIEKILFNYEGADLKYLDVKPHSDGTFKLEKNVDDSFKNGKYHVSDVTIFYNKNKLQNIYNTKGYFGTKYQPYEDLSRLDLYVNMTKLEIPTTEVPTTEVPTTEQPAISTNTKPTVSAVTTNSTSITGKAKSYSTVTAVVNDKVIGTARAKDGKYSIAISKLPAGTKITLYSDYKGVKSASIMTTVVGNTTPTVSSVSNISTIITGNAKSSSTVTAMVNKKVIGKAVAKNGKYNIAIKKLPAGTKVTLYSDYKGVKSASVTAIVIDKIAPVAATVNKVTTKSTNVSGKGERNAVVEIYKGKTKYVTGKVSTKNSFSIKIAKQKKGTILTVYLKDKAGNKSKGTMIKVS